MAPAVILVALLIVFWAVGAYQRLSKQRKQCKIAFVQVEAQTQRRHELIPGLVTAIQGYMPDQRDVLEAVTTADNACIAASTHAGRNVFDIRAIARLIEAEAALEAALNDMFAQAQRHPELSSDQGISQLIDELSAVDSRMVFARQVYNEAASQYNAARVQFPGSVIAFVFAFTAVALLPSATVQPANHS